MPDKQDLNGKVVVVTGASSGFGRGTAVRFAECGATVVVAGRRDDVLDDVARECERAGGKAMAIPADVASEIDVRRLAEGAAGEYGAIDVWVNNAGAAAIGRFEDIPLEDHVRVLDTDLLGTLYGSYFAMRQFRKQGAGTLINVSSVIGKVPSPYFSSYAAAKHGVVGLSASLRQELTEERVDTIHVCTVMPTTFDTPFFEHAAQYTGHEASPIPPTYDPREVVETIVGLATDPQDEVSVGGAAKVFNFAHHLFPGLVERMMASGSLRRPMDTGTRVRGGWKK